MFIYCAQKDEQRLRYHDFTLSGQNPDEINTNHFHLLEINLNKPHVPSDCSNGPSDFREGDKNVKIVQTDRRTDDRQSEKLACTGSAQVS